jgi:hypothetical protein
MISLNHNFVFIHINKSGGTSVCEALHEYEDIQPIALDHDQATIYRDRLGVTLWEEMFSFAILRNPWDRMVSSYEYRRQYHTGPGATSAVGRSFRDWMLGPVKDNPLDREWSDQLWMVTDDDGRGEIIVDQLYLYEQLEAGFKDACSRIGIEAPPLNFYNKTVRDDWDSYYDKDTAALVAERFAADMQWVDAQHPGAWKRPTALQSSRRKRR